MGTLGLAGLGLSDFLRLRASAATQAAVATPDTSVILVWLPGGPPHMEMYDMKPDAPVEYRGIFLPVKTNVNGIEVCEHLPLHTKCADKYNIIRSVSHEFADHGGGHKRFLTGYKPKKPTDTINDFPMAARSSRRKRDHVKRGVPNYIAAADANRCGIDTFAFGPAYLGSATTPFFVSGDPSTPTSRFKISASRPTWPSVLAIANACSKAWTVSATTSTAQRHDGFDGHLQRGSRRAADLRQSKKRLRPLPRAGKNSRTLWQSRLRPART